jgi:hypothetical protein
MARLVITQSQFAPPSGALEQPTSVSEIPTSDDDDVPTTEPQPYWYRHGHVQEGTYRHLLESFSSSKGAKAGLGVAVGAVCVGLLLIVIRLLIRPHKRISFKGKHCIVTGGSSGIGKDVAKVTSATSYALFTYYLYTATATASHLHVCIPDLTFALHSNWRERERTSLSLPATLAASKQPLLTSRRAQQTHHHSSLPASACL